jgi:hypothetical protein
MEGVEERRDENEGLFEKVHVAVGKEVKESKANLIWALQNFDRSKKLVIAHVHKPATTINISKKHFLCKINPHFLSNSSVSGIHEFVSVESSEGEYTNLCFVCNGAN